MRIYINKPEENSTWCEIWVSNKELTKENWKEYKDDIIKIYNQDFLRFTQVISGSGLIEITNPSEELKRAIVRHKILLTFTDAVSKVIQDTPFSLIKDLDKIVISYEGCGDLSSYSKWDDGFEDSII